MNFITLRYWINAHSFLLYYSHLVQFSHQALILFLISLGQFTNVMIIRCLHTREQHWRNTGNIINHIKGHCIAWVRCLKHFELLPLHLAVSISMGTFLFHINIWWEDILTLFSIKSVWSRMVVERKYVFQSWDCSKKLVTPSSTMPKIYYSEIY